MPERSDDEKAFEVWWGMGVETGFDLPDAAKQSVGACWDAACAYKDKEAARLKAELAEAQAVMDNCCTKVVPALVEAEQRVTELEAALRVVVEGYEAPQGAEFDWIAWYEQATTALAAKEDGEKEGGGNG